MRALNIRLDDDQHEALHALAARSGSTVSDLTRHAITRQLAIAAEAADRAASRDDDNDDHDWRDFGRAVIDAKQAVLNALAASIDHEETKSAFAALYAAFRKRVLTDYAELLETLDWSDSVEDLYRLFKRRTVNATLAHQTPAIYNGTDRRPRPPYVSSTIAFATDDHCDVQLPLEQMFFEYGCAAGMDAFEEIPTIWRRAQARLKAGEPNPAHHDFASHRTLVPMPD